MTYTARSMTEKYVIIHRTSDPFQADILGDLLRENGIAARVLGTRHGAAIGVGQSILQQHIEVPQSQAGEATDFLESFFAHEGAYEEGAYEEIGQELDPSPDDAALDDAVGGNPGMEARRIGDGVESNIGDDAGATGRAGTAADGRTPRAPAAQAQGGPLRRLFAGGATLLLFGGSHIYARRFWTALILGAGQVIALLDIRSPHWHTVATGLVMFGIILFLDLSGGQMAVRAHNRGVRTSPLRQMAIGIVLVALAGTIASFVGPRIPVPKRHPERSLPLLQSAIPHQPSW